MSAWTPPLPIPRRPVLGWATFRGDRSAAPPCLLDHPRLQFTTSGRAALLLALEALGVRTGDRVLVPSYHCPSMVAPVVALGAVPVFYAIDPLGHVHLPQLPRGGARALLVAHLFGLPQPLTALRAWCDRTGTALVEDCAHALFGAVEGRALGRWGDLAVGSLTKFLPVSEGGCLADNRRVRHAPDGPQESAGVGVGLKACLDMVEIGALHGRLNGLNAVTTGVLRGLRVLRRTAAQQRLAQFEPRVPEWIENGPPESSTVNIALDKSCARRAIAAPCRWLALHAPRARSVQQRREHYAAYVEALSGQRGFQPLFAALPADCAPYVFALWVDRPDPSYARLRTLGLPVARWDRRWSSLPALPEDCGHTWSHHVLHLPCHQDLTAPQRQFLTQAVVAEYQS